MKYNIIKTDNYLTVVDKDLEINIGDLYIDDYKLLRKSITSDKDYWNSRKDYKKVIAYLPINNSPILEGVSLLPPLQQEDDVDKLAEQDAIEIFENNFSLASLSYQSQFKIGYYKAKEKYKWTDEDVIKIVEKSRETGLTAEYLMLSLFQPKYPIAFECKMEENKLKTTSNPQGQAILVGKYIY